ncbi:MULTISPECIES: ANTAR domain-containing protein [unclassified Streptomyces]|uniref:ANTAR domain-containing protein n=1 Tax=unclassified Streptomyces TaxID=2593676 RepID=UPI003D7461A9
MTRVMEGQLTRDEDPLVIDGRVKAGRAVLTARGELVHGCTRVLTQRLAALPASTSHVELDMAGVVFMDTAGLQFLEALVAYGLRCEVPVAATHWTGQPRRILELAGLDTDDPLHSAHTRADSRGPGPVPSAVSLERAEQLLGLREEVEQLRHALDSRPVIDQARGVLMAVHSCTPEQAWHILREASQLSNTKLRTVAAAVTDSATGPAPPHEVRSALRAAIDRHR